MALFPILWDSAFPAGTTGPGKRVCIFWQQSCLEPAHVATSSSSLQRAGARDGDCSEICRFSPSLATIADPDGLDINVGV